MLHEGIPRDLTMRETQANNPINRPFRIHPHWRIICRSPFPRSLLFQRRQISALHSILFNSSIRVSRPYMPTKNGGTVDFHCIQLRSCRVDGSSRAISILGVGLSLQLRNAIARFVDGSFIWVSFCYSIFCIR